MSDFFSDDLTEALPSAVNCEDGVSLMRRCLKSVLTSRLAFDAFKLFNDETYQYAELGVGAFDSLRELVEDIEEGKEVSHTKAFCRNKYVTKSALACGMGAHPERSFKVPRPSQNTPPEMLPRTDIVFVANHDNSFASDEGNHETPRDPLALIEFGISKKAGHDSMQDLCFQKFAQGIKYINLMTNPNVVSGQKRKRKNDPSSQDTYAFSQPDSQNEAETSDENYSFGILKLEEKKPLLLYTIVYSVTNDEDNDDGLTMMIGCYYCQARAYVDAATAKKKGPRMALLYRHHVQGKEGIATSLKTMLQQIVWFKKKARPDAGTCSDHWMYLGPHCALVTNPITNEKKVYRAYDSRPWPTTRSSAMYEYKETYLHEGTQCVFQLSDALYEEDTASEFTYRLFGYRGCVKIISIPFLPGAHIPVTLDQIVAVVKHLQYFHSKGFVHGDIRLLNMVFSEEKSQLIDFDFGGKVGEAKYPPGYRTSMLDGRRLVEPGTYISRSDDVRALMAAFALLFPTGMGWSKYQREEKPSIDEVLRLLEQNQLVLEADRQIKKFLLQHTKLHDRSEDITGDGDPKSPNK